MLTHPPILRPALVLFVLLSIITGIIYPLAITGVAQLAFPDKANGSLIGYPHAPRGDDARHAERGNTQYLGSSLIGQEFGTSDPAAAPALAKWFWGRPSATSPVPYTALNLDKGTGSSGSNLAPTNPALLDNIKARLAALDAAEASVGIVRRPHAERGDTHNVPIDLVTSSASGLDPHISPEAAEFQIPRIAKARGMSEHAVRALVTKHSTRRTLGVLGEPVVNVLELNLDLNQQRQ